MRKRVSITVSPTRSKRLTKLCFSYEQLTSLLLSSEVTRHLSSSQVRKFEDLVIRGQDQISKWSGSSDCTQLENRLVSYLGEWKIIAAKENVLDMDVQKLVLDLFKKTAKILATVCALPVAKNSIMLSPRSEDTEIRTQEIEEYSDVIKKLEDELKDKEKTLEEKKSLEEELRAAKRQQDTLKKELETIQNDKKAEDLWNLRITEAFRTINKQTELLENEKERVKIEYIVFNWTLAFIIVIFIAWAFFFIKWHFNLNASSLVSYSQIIPWTTPLPFMVALFWVVVIQRNKSNRKIFRLTEEVFKIKYVEGLLLAINKLSITTEEGILRINNLLDEIIKSYIRQMETFLDAENSKPDKDAPIEVEDAVKLIDSISAAIHKK